MRKGFYLSFPQLKTLYGTACNSKQVMPISLTVLEAR